MPDTEFTLDQTQPEPAVVHEALVDQPHVLMSRDPKRGGKGVMKMLVPAGEVANYKAAGWFEV